MLEDCEKWAVDSLKNDVRKTAMLGPDRPKTFIMDITKIACVSVYSKVFNKYAQPTKM